MLQRIQSIFILLYIVCMVVFLFNDTMHIAVGSRYYVLNAWGLSLKYPIDGLCCCDIEQVFPYLVSGILQIVAIMLVSIAFFSYRNRKKQILLIQIAEYLFVAEILSILYAGIVTIKGLSYDSYNMIPKIGVLFLSSSILWLLLAKFYTKKDERLVQASDRLI